MGLIRMILRGKVRKLLTWATLIVIAVGLIGTVVNDTADRDAIDTIASDDGTPLLILMYHNIIPNNAVEGDYEVSVSTLEADLKYLADNGYTSLTTAMLDKVARGEMSGGKYVMLTFDDGFYSYIKYLPWLLEKYDMYAVASVVGEFSSNVNPNKPRGRCSYLTFAEVSALTASGRVEIANHTYDLHHLTKAARGVRIATGESITAYRNRFIADTRKLESEMTNVGVAMSSYVYPYGEYSLESEVMIKNLGYKASFTCNEHVNYITNHPNSLYLLGRYNRSASYGALSNLIATIYTT